LRDVVGYPLPALLQRVVGLVTSAPQMAWHSFAAGEWGCSDRLGVRL
jgi:hypothetical protein